MPGDEWQRHANLRLLYGFMFGHPGKQLLFMGGEIAQEREWTHAESIDWHLLDRPLHAGLRRWVRDLHLLYRGEPALYELDAEPSGFEWIDCDDRGSSVLSFLRRAAAAGSRSSSSATSPLSRGTTTRSACRTAAPGANG